tara:strand:+ start:453 stop:572 length:120 start_codon:yes stop_codon:yes gene_type:complete
MLAAVLSPIALGVLALFAGLWQNQSNPSMARIGEQDLST